eukprot:COSAG01_NODE_2026_length_8601_cov_74.674430_3_plen_135_part_00
MRLGGVLAISVKFDRTFAYLGGAGSCYETEDKAPGDRRQRQPSGHAKGLGVKEYMVLAAPRAATSKLINLCMLFILGWVAARERGTQAVGRGRCKRLCQPVERSAASTVAPRGHHIWFTHTATHTTHTHPTPIR